MMHPLKRKPRRSPGGADFVRPGGLSGLRLRRGSSDEAEIVGGEAAELHALQRQRGVGVDGEDRIRPDLGG